MSQLLAAPTALVATARDKSISVAFTLPATSSSTSAITNFQYSINSGTTYTPVNPPQTTSPILISGLTNGTAYTISLKAVNSTGPGTASTSITSTPIASAESTASTELADTNTTTSASATDGVVFVVSAIVAGGIAINALSSSSSGYSEDPGIFQIVVSRLADLACLILIAYTIYYLYGNATDTDRESALNSIQTKLNDWFVDPTSMLVYLIIATLGMAFLSLIIGSTLGLDAKPGFLGIAESAVFMALIVTMGIWASKYILHWTPTDILGNARDKIVDTKAEIKAVVSDKEVFNVSSNIYTYDEAQSICETYGAELATYKQVEAAYNSGGEWCNYGWSAGQMALFPTQHSTWGTLNATELYKNACGRPGVNGGYIANPKVRFGVNCYGKKPAQTDADRERMKAASFPPHSSKGTIQDLVNDAKVNFWKKHSDTFLRLNPFNRTEWSD